MIVAGLALLGLTLAGSLKAASVPLAATPLSESEMKDVRAGTVVVIEITSHYGYCTTVGAYITVQTPYGPQQVAVGVGVNAYLFLNNTGACVASYVDNSGYFSIYYAPQKYNYQGGPLDGQTFTSLQNVPYFHVVNGWPVSGL